MKKIYLAAAGLMVAAGIQAQVPTQSAVLVDSKRVDFLENNQRTATDTLGISDGTFAPNGDVTSYGSAGGGWIFGVNTVNVGSPTTGLRRCAQGYIWTGDAAVEEVLIWFTAKESVSADPSASVTVEVYRLVDGAATGGDLSTGGQSIMGPTTILGSKELLFDDCDTTFLAFNTVTFDSPVPVVDDFAVGVNFEGLYQSGDTLGILSDGVGDAEGLEYTFSSLRANNAWYSTSALYGGALDNHAAIFPVIDANYVGIESNNFFNGMKMDIYPNPAVNNAQIAFALENNDDVTVQVFDITGKTIYTETLGSLSAGIHNIQLDTEDLASGNYYVSIKNSKNRLTKKLVITK